MKSNELYVLIYNLSNNSILEFSAINSLIKRETTDQPELVLCFSAEISVSLEAALVVWCGCSSTALVSSLTTSPSLRSTWSTLAATDANSPTTSTRICFKRSSSFVSPPLLVPTTLPPDAWSALSLDDFTTGSYRVTYKCVCGLNV